MWCIVGGITFFGGIVFGMFGFPFLFSFSWFSTGIPSVFLALYIFQFGIQIVAVTVITIRTRRITVTWFTWGWDIFFRFPFAILFQFLPYTFLNMLGHAVGPVVIPQLIKEIPIIWLVKLFYIYLFFYTNLSVAKYWWYISVQG